MQINSKSWIKGNKGTFDCQLRWISDCKNYIIQEIDNASLIIATIILTVIIAVMAGSRVRAMQRKMCNECYKRF